LKGQEFVDFTTLKARKVNKTSRGFIGTIKILIPDMNNDWKVAFFLHKKQGGEYRKLPYNRPLTGICTEMSLDKFVMPEILIAFKAPNPMPCPFPQVI
jgi:hypothetical protein